MKCFNCNCEDDVCTFGEVYECNHCNEDNLIEYNTCTNCKISWKSVNGKVVENSIFTEDQLKDVFDEELVGNIDSIIENITESLVGDQVESKDSMSSMITKCLMCNSISYEVERSGNFKCSNSKCGFQWEVISCG
jgi:hypothetical protein